MKGILTKSFSFESGHFLPGHPKCGHQHGHSFKLEISVGGLVKENGFVIDFHDLKDIVYRNAVEFLDHRNINDIIKMPTCENISGWIWEKLEDRFKEIGIRLIKVGLRETDNSYYEYYGE